LKADKLIQDYKLDYETQLIIKTSKQWAYTASHFNEILGALNTDKTHSLLSEIALSLKWVVNLVFIRCKIKMKLRIRA
jgi:hypothetical protein